MRWFLYWLLLVVATPAWSQSPSLSSSTDLSSEGYFVLSWDSLPSAAQLELQQSNTGVFSVVRRWPVDSQGQLTVTGLADGQYFFRIASGSDALTEIIEVDVQHHALSRAGQFFALGLVLFIILMVTIAIGMRQSKESLDD